MKKYIKYFAILFIIISLFGCHKADNLEGLDGTWFLNDNSVIVIRDKEFYWYQSNQNPNDNFFYGNNLEILFGEEAIKAIQVPESNKDKLLDTHIYYLKVTYSQYHMNGEDLSSQLDNKFSEFAIQISTKDKLNIMNLNTNISYTAVRGDD